MGGLADTGLDRDAAESEDAASADLGRLLDADPDAVLDQVDADVSDDDCLAGPVAPPGFVCVPAGRFEQGQVGIHDAAPRRVALTRSFFIQVHEVTQGEWRALMGANPSSFQGCGDTCPVERITWFDAVAFANARSVAAGLAPCYAADGAVVGGATPYDCAGYRLPTEAEWEYAYRAGTQTAFYWGDDETDASTHGWFAGNSDSTTHPVGTRLPNAWGLHDMAGNVFEWVDDEYEAYSAGPVIDPWNARPAARRAYRGGCWAFSSSLLRAALRSGNPPDDRFHILGLRLARTRTP